MESEVKAALEQSVGRTVRLKTDEGDIWDVEVLSVDDEGSVFQFVTEDPFGWRAGLYTYDSDFEGIVSVDVIS